MSLTKAEIQHVAALARLQVAEEEIGVLSEELEKILAYVDQLQQLDVTGIEAMSHVGVTQNVTRPDVPGISLLPEIALANGPDVEEQQFRVPAVLEG
ncbi:Asp-tRNA(Asn)/Glu-tRNA(Gln) amidotransferase subunit GatC [Sulfoacidibacillus thermotolerans]|uniref:Aspartyl/glutamyl-tRNA(Asn/Gln) amidotransferase subunit C n=1 Tax=Sulfoacidibacillus thermotolerans TaxID=1765684 RepID=A0A2U3D7J5_SULT2|nr:Asp-tRNA(Asn)/Glu-tRNA(Gln) amidotransferase subunit GatC [Sulfoacidibacillus thermotolerans]PWI57257.1 hypothetical protein BM613_09745 [Sulfoacidibacillus thermotolerans]